ncbi:HAD family hydrolase [Solibacillus silvestris]|uniref:HAD family hydrolase n=1 Tax=Solibacillus silvestris TaxID=76853 RepID=UPI003F7E6BBF
MQLFTSDLDRTLIFSKRTIQSAMENCLCIEQLEEREISYINASIEQLLQQIHHHMHFVPVTTRSVAQYERITLFQQAVVPEAAIVANGGIIFRNGQIDPVWQQHIEQQLTMLPLSLEQIGGIFSKQLSANYFLRHHIIDDLYYCFIVDPETADLNEIRHLNEALQQYEWHGYLQGRKFYILPKFLTKGAAVQYIKSLRHYDRHFAAGDSLMDMSMLQLADHYFVPLHGELTQYAEQLGLSIVQKSGADFAEHCLRQILMNSMEKGSLKWST